MVLIIILTVIWIVISISCFIGGYFLGKHNGREETYDLEYHMFDHDD